MRERTAGRVRPDSDSDSGLLLGRNPRTPNARAGFTAGLTLSPASAPPSLIADGSESHAKGEAASVTARRRREMSHEVVIMPSYQIAVCSA